MLYQRIKKNESAGMAGGGQRRLAESEIGAGGKDGDVLVQYDYGTFSITEMIAILPPEDLNTDPPAMELQKV